MLNKTIPVGVDGSSATITSYVFAPTEDAYALKPLPAVSIRWHCKNSRGRSIPSEAMRQSTVSILIGLRSWVFRPVGI